MTNLFDLLDRGYFPRELPPTFTSAHYANAVVNNFGSMPNSFTNATRLAKLCNHSIARVNLQRRRASIPNPVSYYNLAKDIATNWGQIQSQTRSSTISKSIPTPTSGQGRSVIPQFSHDELLDVRSAIRASARYVVKTDIAKFYHSIYTHSIPWAVHGKTYAKQNRRNHLLGNSLDRWVRNGQDGQTIGIPIGPDSSLVIAEILLSAFDADLMGKLHNVPLMRHVDDFELAFRSYSDAEEALSVLQQVLGNYELQLNFAKTKIIELPVPLESVWVTPLRNHTFRTTPKGQRADLIRYIDLAYRLMKEHEDDHVLKYAVQRLRYETIDPTNWPLTLDFLIQSLIAETGVCLQVLAQLMERHGNGYAINLNSIEEILNFLLCKQCPLNHGSEASWSLWAVLYWDLKVSPDAAKAISQMEDSIVALLALDAQSRGLIPSGLDTTIWQTFMTKNSLYGEQWLLSYEARIKDWLPSNDRIDHVDDDPNFSWLKSFNVEFYDAARVRTSTPTSAAPSALWAPLFSLG